MSFFFTLLDDSLRPRGSRDPIGLELVWSMVGRKLVGNLTTVTSSLDNFIMALLGFYLCGDEGRAAPAWELFERFEQATGHARAIPGVLGIRRIEASKNNETVLLGNSPNARILDDQKRAGIWGLYSTALTVTGLSTAERLLTLEGHRIAEIFLAASPYVDVMSPVLNRQCKVLQLPQKDAISRWVLAVIECQVGRDALSEALLSGGSQGSAWQQELYRQCQKFLQIGSAADGAVTVRQLLRYLVSNSEPLASYAKRLEALDEALALANQVFFRLLACHGLSESKVVEEMSVLNAWPKHRLLVPDFPELTDSEWRRRMAVLRKLCEDIRNEDWQTAIRSLLDYHRTIMEPRGGSPWCFIENEKIKVVTSSSGAPMPSANELYEGNFEKWMAGKSTGYFLPSFLSVLQQTTHIVTSP